VPSDSESELTESALPAARRPLSVAQNGKWLGLGGTGRTWEWFRAPGPGPRRRIRSESQGA
jgi:hypothetical protein